MDRLSVLSLLRLVLVSLLKERETNVLTRHFMLVQREEPDTRSIREAAESMKTYPRAL